jgi:hypothetical protein
LSRKPLLPLPALNFSSSLSLSDSERDVFA